jgi:hypothetical protein
MPFRVLACFDPWWPVLKKAVAGFAFRWEHQSGAKDVPMAIEDDPLYPNWRSAVEIVIATREVRDTHPVGSKEYDAANAEHQRAVAALAALDAPAGGPTTADALFLWLSLS